MAFTFKKWIFRRRVSRVIELGIHFSETTAASRIRRDPRARFIGGQLAAALGRQVESIVYYPHPYCSGGFVVVLRDEVMDVIDPLTTAFRYIPPDMSLHCLRFRELFEISLPAFNWLHILNRRLHLPFCVRHGGIVLYGRDIRDKIGLPDPGVLLGLHLEACAHFVRNHAILGLLMRNEHRELIRRLEWQIRCLMGTTLLAFGLWDVTIKEIPAHFEQTLGDPRLNQTWRDLSDLAQRVGRMDAEACRKAAYEAVWLFECFVRRLRDYAR